jgi:hypothetical protein
VHVVYYCIVYGVLNTEYMYHRQSAFFVPAPRSGGLKEKACQTLIISVPGSDTKEEPLLDPGVMDGRCPERAIPATLPPPGAGDC